MSLLSDSPVFQIYVASAILLGVNLIVLAGSTAASRNFAGQVVNPEDRRLNAAAVVVYDAADERTERIRRAHRNALENVPLFLVTGFLLALTDVSVPVAATLYGTFVAARLLHSLAYVAAVQPWRTASFGVGVLVQFALFAALGYQVFLG